MSGSATTAPFALHIPAVRNDLNVLTFDGVEAISQTACLQGSGIVLEHLRRLIHVRVEGNLATQRQYFADQLIEHGQQYFSEYLQGLDAVALQQWASQCQQSAARHGYSAIDEVLRWARLHAVLGTDFPDAPAHAAFRRLLAEPGVSPRHRLDNLNVELTRQPLTDKELGQ